MAWMAFLLLGGLSPLATSVTSLLLSYPNTLNVVLLDNFSSSSNSFSLLANLSEAYDKRVHIVAGDIFNEELVGKLLREFQVKLA